MIKLIAKKRFMNGGVIVERGENFSVRSEQIATEFILRELAQKVEHNTKEAAPAEVKATEEDTGLINYEGMTVSQLKELAKDKGIEGYTGMRKADLITAIERL